MILIMLGFCCILQMSNGAGFFFCLFVFYNRQDGENEPPKEHGDQTFIASATAWRHLAQA